MKYPWEVNPWLAMVMGKPKAVCEPIECPPFPAVPAKEKDDSYVPAQTRTLFPQQRKRKQGRPWQMEVDEARQVTLETWFRMLIEYPAASKATGQMMQHQTRDEKMQVLRDILENKATSTIRSRALDFGYVLNWLVKSGGDPSDISERDCYTYCGHLRDERAAPTSGNRFKEAVTFARYVFGWTVSDDAISSTR
eukprot:657873-Amphidinium_carterae.1